MPLNFNNKHGYSWSNNNHVKTNYNNKYGWQYFFTWHTQRYIFIKEKLYMQHFSANLTGYLLLKKWDSLSHLFISIKILLINKLPLKLLSNDKDRK